MNHVPVFKPDSLFLKLQFSNLPTNWDEQKVKQFLQPYGWQISDIHVGKKEENRGTAQVKFNQMQDGEKAMKQLRDAVVEGQTISVRWADGESSRLQVAEDQLPKLQVDPLPKECDEHTVRQVFERHGQVTDVQITQQTVTSAIVSYTFKESCLQAIKNIHNRCAIGDRPLDVRFVGQSPTLVRQVYQDPSQEEDPIKDITKSFTRWLDAKKKPIYIHWETGEIVRSVNFGSIIYSPDGTKEVITKEKYLNDLATFNSKKTGPPGANLFVFHLPNEHKDSDLMELFSPYGNVISARVMTDPRTGKSKGFGFVSFDKQESAQKAKEAMDGHLIDKKKLSVTFKQNDGTSIQPLQYQWLPSIMQIQFDPFDL